MEGQARSTSESFFKSHRVESTTTVNSFSGECRTCPFGQAHAILACLDVCFVLWCSVHRFVHGDEVV